MRALKRQEEWGWSATNPSFVLLWFRPYWWNWQKPKINKYAPVTESPYFIRFKISAFLLSRLDLVAWLTWLSQETPGSRDSDSRARVTMLSVPDIAMSPVASWIRDELTPPQSQHGHSALSTSVTMRIFRVYLVIAVIMGSAVMSFYDQLLGR